MVRVGATSGMRALSSVLALGLAIGLAGLPGTSAAASAPAVSSTGPAAGTKSADAKERPDAVSAMVTAHATGNRIENLAQRTETTQVFANPDGTWTAEQADGPVRVQDEEGAWADIDTELVKVDGGYAPKSAGDGLLISDGGDHTFVNMGVDDHALKFQWPTTLPVPDIDGATATYKDAVPNGDLVVTATPTGFSHDIVLRQAPADVTTFKVPVTTGGPKLTEDSQGNLAVTTKAGDDLITADQPMMYDSSVSATGDPEHIQQVDAIVTQNTTTAGGGVLTLQPDQTFLTDPTTQYPVTIDPSYTGYAYTDTWIQSPEYPSGNGGSGELRAGTVNGGNSKARSYVAFPFGPWQNQQITSASLRLNNWYSAKCTPAGDMRVARLYEGWSADTMTWTNQPSATTPVSLNNQSYGASGCSAAQDMAWDVTATVQGWADGTWPKYGFRLMAVDETDSTTWRRWRSADYATTATRPRLVVNYNRAPVAPAYPNTTASRTYNGAIYVSSAKPTWATSTTDPDGGTVKLTTEVRTNNAANATLAASCTSALVASGSTAACTPTQTLTNGATYYARSRGTDQSGFSGPWTAFRTIKIDSGVPATPTLSCTNLSNGSWYETRPAATTTCSVSGTSADTEVTVNGATKPALGPTGSMSVDIPPSGYTAIQMRARSRSGAVSAWAKVAFGTGHASLLAPTEGDRSSSTFPVQAAAPSGATSAKVQWRFAPSTTGTPDPDAGWTDATQVDQASSGAAWTGSVSGTDTSATPELIWDPSSETGITSTALVEVRVVFTYSGGIKVSPSQRVTVMPHAFGGTFPTSPVGPGQVALFTGEFQYSENDVSVPGYGGDLTLGRSQLSMAGTQAGPAGVFGPGWKSDLAGPDGGMGGFAVTDHTATDGSIVLSSPDGESYTYRHQSGAAGAQKLGKYIGVGETALDEDLLQLESVTTEPGISHRLTLTESDGTRTIFVRTNGVWTAEKVIGAEDNSTTTYIHDGDGMVTWILAPAPAGATCNASGQQPGCRALHLNYTGTGTSKRLTSVDLRIYNPHTGSDGLPGAGAAMDTITVANYAYNTGGQLVATWDPRLGDGTAALKTQYTYVDINGHTALSTITEPGLKPWTMNYGANGKLASVTRDQDAAVGGTSATWTIRYDLALSGGGLPDLTPAATAAWAQQAVDAPVAGAAVFGPDKVPAPGTTPTADDYSYASLSYWTESGRLTNSAVFGASSWQIDSQRYDDRGNTIWTLTAAGRNQALAEGSTAGETAGAAQKYAGFTVYNADGTRVEETYSPTRDFVLMDGTPFSGRTLSQTVYDDEDDAAGFTDGRNNVPAQGFDLPVREFTSSSDATDPGDGPMAANKGLPRANREFDTREVRYRYDPISAGDGDGWQLHTPTKVLTQDGAGWSTTSSRFDSEGKITETRSPQSNASTGTAASARTMRTDYYTAGASAARSECQFKPQWAGQVCWHGAAGAPSSGAAIPDVATVAYSVLLDPTKTVQSSGGATRSNVTVYDAAGRLGTSSVTTSGLATADRPVAATTTTYSTTTGALESISNGSQTQSTSYDSWGRVKTQTDGTGNSATTSYDAAGRVASRSDGKGTYTYTYNGTDSQGKTERRGLVTRLKVGLTTSPDEFTGAYDDSGALTEQNYPGGIKASWTRDLTGAPTELAYTQGSSALLAFSNTLDAEGRVRETSTTGGKQSYTYDDRGRLTQVQDQTATDCTTREYAFSEDSNRRSLQTFTPDTREGNEGNCQNTASNTASPAFDDADRITNPGYTYDKLGRTLTVPAADTTTNLGSPSNLTVSYHANDMVAGLSQSGLENGTTVTKSQDMTIDATDRISTIKNLTGGVSLEESTNHYDAGDDSPAWSATQKRPNANTAWASSWSRNVTSLDGGLSIVQSSDGTANIQLANLHGDVVSIAPVGAVGIGSFTDTDEYGSPRDPIATSSPYGWLGSKQRQSGGVIGGLVLMGARLYNPRSGRFLSRDPIAGGNANSYGYPEDPVNKTDLNGQSWKWLHRGIRFVSKHRGTIATIGAAGLCLTPGVNVVACGVAQAAAFAVRADQRIRKHGGYRHGGVRRTWRRNFADGLLTYLSFGVGQTVKQSLAELEIARARKTLASWAIVTGAVSVMNWTIGRMRAV